MVRVWFEVLAHFNLILPHKPVAHLTLLVHKYENGKGWPNIGSYAAYRLSFFKVELIFKVTSVPLQAPIM